MFRTSVKLWSIIISFLSSITCLAQVPSSLSLSPYASIDRIRLNPALGINSAYKWDATIVGGHISTASDYTFLRSANLLNIISRSSDATIIDAISEIPETSDVPVLIFDLDGGRKSFYLSGTIAGPSFSVGLGEDTRLGVFTNARVHASSTMIPENLGIYELNESYQTNVINFDEGVASFASWLEIGAHLSKRIDELSFGVNLKILRANEGGYINSKETTAYEFIDSVIIINSAPNVEMALTNSTINANTYRSTINGSGIGLDIGVAYNTDFLSAGISLNDIGVLRYKTNVEIYSREILSTLTDVRTQDYRSFENLRDLLDRFQNFQGISPDNFGVFSVGLPTRLTLYGDYLYDDKISISGVINQRLPIFANSLAANNSLVITPRYETDVWSYYLPITILEYSSFRIGSAFRIGPLTIGTDHLSSVFLNTDFNGSDLYFNLKIYPFNSTGTKGGKDVLCPTF